MLDGRVQVQHSMELLDGRELGAAQERAGWSCWTEGLLYGREQTENLMEVLDGRGHDIQGC